MQEKFSTTNSSIGPEMKMENPKEIIPGVSSLFNHLNKNLELLKEKMALFSENNLTVEKLSEYAKEIEIYSSSAFEKDQEFLNNLGYDSKKADSNKSEMETLLLFNLHEVKTIFMAVWGYSQIVTEEELLSDEFKKHILSMNEGLKRIEKLLKKIIKAEKPDDFNEILEVDINTEIKNMVSFLAEEAKNKNIEIKIESEIGNADLIKVHLDNFTSIINNIITNAVKFTNENGLILIKIKKMNNFIEISIKDNGIGLKEDKLLNFFEKPGESTPGTRGEIGTGVGMVTSKRIVDKMGGDLRVESQGEGKGTTFILTLPIEEKVKNNN